jgi:hypothetical protein
MYVRRGGSLVGVLRQSCKLELLLVIQAKDEMTILKIMHLALRAN